jgi:hypothetical protein
MSATWIDNYEGQRVDAETLSTPELERIAQCLRDDLAEHGNWPEQVEWLEGQLAEVEQILEERT